MLDERLRGHIQGLAEAEEPTLDEAARERILALIREEGPAIVRSARRRRFAIASSAALSVAAAAAALFIFRHPGELETAKVENGARTKAAVCASRTVPAGARAGFVAGESGARLDLGSVALAASMPGTSVRLEEASACRTIIALESGTVAVHAKDLGGGELRVRTSRGDVVVHGTIFAVTRDATSLAVEVVVGNVSVTDRDDTHAVTTGQRLLLSAVGAAEGPLEPDRAVELRSVLGIADGAVKETASVTRPTETPATSLPAAGTVAATPRVAVARAEEPRSTRQVPEVTLESEEPAPTAQAPAAPTPPADPLAMAEQARRAGDYGQARELYRRAADGTGVTAEAAWVALARMELSLGHTAQARAATKQRQDRFGRGTLSPEALWIDVRSYRQSGDPAKARELANQLSERWPSSPQARAAEQWLAEH
ncbi:MAG TPA: FecR domain-containing protein [Polyangiaceae bacterium]|jgi:hypothetical protein|nr:FecR domain-containing protein [Polyangiaceae bacterium]